MKYSPTNIAILVLVISVIVLLTIYLANPSLLRSAAAGIHCAAKEARLRHLLSQDRFVLTGDVKHHEKLGEEIHHLRKELHREGCLSDEHFHLSIARQGYRLFLESLSWEITPMSHEERKKHVESPNYKYMQRHINELARETQAHKSKYICAILHMQKEEDHHWLSSNPFGTSKEGKMHEEQYRVNMLHQLHKEMVEAKCIHASPSVHHMIQKHH